MFFIFFVDERQHTAKCQNDNMKMYGTVPWVFFEFDKYMKVEEDKNKVKWKVKLK